jgi:hypothetical protein
MCEVGIRRKKKKKENMVVDKKKDDANCIFVCVCVCVCVLKRDSIILFIHVDDASLCKQCKQWLL